MDTRRMHEVFEKEKSRSIHFFGDLLFMFQEELFQDIGENSSLFTTSHSLSSSTSPLLSLYPGRIQVFRFEQDLERRNSAYGEQDLDRVAAEAVAVVPEALEV